MIQITPEFLHRLRMDCATLAAVHPDAKYTPASVEGSHTVGPSYIDRQLSGVSEPGCAVGVALRRRGVTETELDELNPMTDVQDDVLRDPAMTLAAYIDATWLMTFQDKQDGGMPLGDAAAEADKEAGEMAADLPDDDTWRIAPDDDDSWGEDGGYVC